MLPHPGYGEAMAHVSLSTGIMGVSIAFHDEIDVTQWHLYSNPAIHAGSGLCQGEGHIFREDGRLVASYTDPRDGARLRAGSRGDGARRVHRDVANEV